jgi:hypothetical protein
MEHPFLDVVHDVSNRRASNQTSREAAVDPFFGLFHAIGQTLS